MEYVPNLASLNPYSAASKALKRELLTGRETANFLLGAGQFEFRGLQVRDSQYQELEKYNRKSFLMRGLGALGGIERTLPFIRMSMYRVGIFILSLYHDAYAAEQMVPDADTLFTLSNHFQVRAGDLIVAIDHILDEPEVDFITWRSIKFTRETLKGMQSLWPFLNGTRSEL